MLRTKSIQAPIEPDDNIRVCVMRHPSIDLPFDIWIPRLAPSRPLLDQYRPRHISWEEYKQAYFKEIFEPQRKYLELLINLAKKQVVTILCWEESGEVCHRRLVVEYCTQIDPTVQFCTDWK